MNSDEINRPAERFKLGSCIIILEEVQNVATWDCVVTPVNKGVNQDIVEENPDSSAVAFQPNRKIGRQCYASSSSSTAIEENLTIFNIQTNVET